MEQQQKPQYLQDVKNIIVVLSGKGGVGKSTVACQLAFALAGQGKKVGILDVDICGPSVPKILGVEHKNVVQGKSGWIPVPATVAGDSETKGTLSVMSIAFLLSGPNDAVVWRGPRKDSMIKQFCTAVEWGELDYLIIDTPPGTSDEHMTLCEALMPLDPTGAVVVTTPQKVAVDDVKKELSFCAKLKLRCLGIVENMSGYVCPHCTECTPIFSKGGGEKLAKQYELPFLGAIPIDPRISISEDAGRSFVESYKAEAIAQAQKESGADAAGEESGAASPKPAGAVGAVMSVIEEIGKQVLRVEAVKQRQRVAAERPHHVIGGEN